MNATVANAPIKTPISKYCTFCICVICNIELYISFSKLDGSDPCIISW